MYSIKPPIPPRTLPVFCPLFYKEQCDEYRKDLQLYSRPITDGCNYDHYEIPSNVHENIKLYAKASHCISKLNDEAFKYDIDYIKLHYCGLDDRGIFPPTTPYLNRDNRQIKLAFMINLNDDYEGGMSYVGIRDEQRAVVSGVDVGTLIAFPSFFTININPPLGSGRKEFILGYSYGPDFK